MLGILIKQERIRQNISQANLCKNICTTSYLSKVENDVAVCSDEIYEQLLKKLNIKYINDEELCNQIDTEFNGILNLLREDGYCSFVHMKNPISPLCIKMRYSKQCVKATLLLALRNTFKHISKKEIEQLDYTFSYLNENERLIYFFIKSIYFRQNKNLDMSIKMLQTILNLQEPWVYQGIAFNFYGKAEYQKASEKYIVAYNGFSEIGAIKGMLDTARNLFVTYCNNFDLEKMIKWSNIFQKINSVMKEEITDCFVEYNMGTTYLMYGNVDKAIYYLSKCEKFLLNHRDELFENSTYLRLSFAYAIQGEIEKAIQTIKKVNTKELDGHWKLSFKITKYIINNKDYLNKSEYAEVLEECMSFADNEYSRGFSQFYAHYLLQSYKSQRQYKKATSLFEKINFLNITENSH